MKNNQQKNLANNNNVGGGSIINNSNNTQKTSSNVNATATSNSNNTNTNSNGTALTQAYEDMIANSNANKQQVRDTLAKQNTSALSQLYNAKQNAMKYADTTAQAQGYATQGSAVQANSSLQNAYLNQVQNQNSNYQQSLANSDASYDSEINNIKLNQAQAQDTENTNLVNNYVNAMSVASNEDTLNKYYQEALSKGFGGSNLQAIQMAYEAQAENLGIVSDEQKAINSKIDAMNATYNTDITSTAGENAKISVEQLLNTNNDAKLRHVLNDIGTGNEKSTKLLQYALKNLDVEDGDVIQLGTDVYVMYNGYLYKSNEKGDGRVKGMAKYVIKTDNFGTMASLKDKKNGKEYIKKSGQGIYEQK